MNRPIVTINDVDKAYPNTPNWMMRRKLIPVSNDLFIERRSSEGRTKILLYRYTWSDGQIERLFNCDVDQSFTVFDNCADQLAMQLKDGKLELYRITNEGIHLLDSIEIGLDEAQLHQVTHSMSLIYMQGSVNKCLYYIDPKFKLKYVATVDGSCPNLKLRNGLLIDKEYYDTRQLKIEVNDKWVQVRDFSKELCKPVFVADNSVDLYMPIDQYLGVDCSLVTNAALPEGFRRLMTLPSGEKIVLIYQWMAEKVYMVRVCARSRKLVCSIVLKGVYPTNSYCHRSGLQYFIKDSKIGSINVETLDVRMTGKSMTIPRDHLWFPRPTYRDLLVKYVPILEANTNLPTDLCRLVTSYLDW